MSGCAPFRAELERALTGAPPLARLADHEHARACASCRAELERERALEAVLERLPAPEVPPALARRLLSRLEPARLRPGASRSAPSVTEDGLEELLQRLPAPTIPSGLAERVLAGVARSRAPRARSGWRGWLLLAAAAAVVVSALWVRSLRGPAARRVELAQRAVELENDEELLAYAVERWELLHDEDLDLWLASLDPLDELLIEYAVDESWFEDGSGETRGD